jgi:outer membrane protein assembly factor BamE (lipoprotein component of BamABCDE complex)
MHRVSRIFLAGLSAAALTACASVQTQRGYVPDPVAIQGIMVGMDTKDTVSKKLGDPSTAASFGNDVWYYISSHVQQTAFFGEQPLDRNIVAVEFNKGGQVADIKRYTLADGRVVDFVSRVTPTRGRELSLLQQIFNAVPGQIGQPGGGPNGQNPGNPGNPGPGGPGGGPGGPY